MKTAGKKTAGAVVRKLFLDNVGYKIVGIFCSLIFFYSFQTERTGTRTVSTDIMAIMDSPSDEYILVSQFPSQIAMKLEGPISTLKTLKGQDLGPLIIPISDFRSRIFQFNQNIIESLPKGVHIIKFYPDSIPLQFERRVEKLLPVVPAVEDAPAPGRVLVGPVKVTPEMVKVRGAESAMKKIDRWETQAIYVETLAPGVHEVKVNLAPPKIPHVTPEEENVTARVEIDYKMITKWFRSVPLVLEHKEGLKNFTLRPVTVSVLLDGPEELLRPLESDQLYFFVEVTAEEIGAGGSFQAEVQHSPLPDRTTVKKLFPAKATVTIKPPAP
jgi:YbbR domain-containing protein